MKITKEDINFLYYLYRLRCLSLAEIHCFFYTNKNFYKEKVVPLVGSGLCSFHQIKNEYALMITQKGINLMQKYMQIPNEVYNIQKKKTEKLLLKEKDIIVEEKFASHQITLNSFVLKFRMKFGRIKYFDEKFLSGMSNIRPDGMIRLENLDLFLEQDMGTESSKQLKDKWNRYRRYLATEFTGERRIVVLFIIKCQNIESRAHLIRKTILETLDQLVSNNFEIYIGSEKELLEACFNRILPGDKKRTKEFAELMQKSKFRINDGSKLKVKLGGTVYRYYFGRYNEDNKLLYYHPNKQRFGRFAEFLGDNYDYEPFSVLSKISFHDKNSHNFDIAYSPRPNLRLIGYIVLTRNIRKLYKQLKSCDLLKVKNVYYTTPERLMKLPLPKALLHFDDNGNVYTCNDYYFEPTNKEGNINSFDENGLKEIV